MQPGQVVLVDTNIIIECVRVGCWGALKAHFSVETVEKCCEEARTGELHRPGYVLVEEKALRERLKAHKVAPTEIAALVARDPDSRRLDAGELHLWAHAFARGDAWIASCCDAAAVHAAIRLGWEDRLKSLEELTRAAGANPAAGRLKEQFGAARLSAWRTAALLRRGLT
jgi:hypothetical protein